MNYKKFGPDDILQNSIKTYPQNSIFIDSTGSIFIKNLGQIFASDNKNSSLVAGSALNLTNNQYKLTYEGGKFTYNIPKTFSSLSLYANSSPLISNNYFSSSIKIFAITSSNDTANFNDFTCNTGIAQSIKLIALKNTLDWYSSVSPSYNSKNFIISYSTNPNNQISVNAPNNLILVNVPSIFYGSSIKRGSVELNYYITGTLIGKLADSRYNGELVEVTGSNTGSTAGVILYDEGIILLSGSWSLNNSIKDNYTYVSKSSGKSITTDVPRWNNWGKSFLSSSLLNSSSFEIDFQGTNTISSLTMFTHVNKNECNISNNKTFIQHSQQNFNYVVTSSNSYIENREILIKNTIKTAYANTSGSFKKQTFINKIGIYDENKKLIAIAKLATPVKKNNEREYTFKLKMDI